MVRHKDGWPDEGELVIATVTKIQYHSVFCNLDEYSKSGMMHISEIAPGRIKNIGEYVKEGKTLVLKVLKIDKDKGHIDLSLRRVTEAQKRQKASELKQQQIVENIAKQLTEKGHNGEKILSELEKQFSEYHSVYDAFMDVVEDKTSISGFDKKLTDEIVAAIKERLKPKAVRIKGEFSIHSWDPQGVERIREAFSDTHETVRVSYAGGGRYTVIVEDKNYKHAEETLKHLREHVKEHVPNAEVVFERTDKK